METMGRIEIVYSREDLLFDVRNAQGEKVKLLPGMWYVGVGYLPSEGEDAPMVPAPDWHHHCGAIAQYVGDCEFYDGSDDGSLDGPRQILMQDYQYIVESHMGKL